MDWWDEMRKEDMKVKFSDADEKRAEREEWLRSLTCRTCDHSIRPDFDTEPRVVWCGEYREFRLGDEDGVEYPDHAECWC